MNESKILTTFTVEKDISYMIAVDEVGRGAGAGPVVVCASVWRTSPKSSWIKSKWLPLIADSKQLTQAQREECFALICNDYMISSEYFCADFKEIARDSRLTYSNLIKPIKILKFSQKELKTMEFQKKELFDCVCFSLGIASNHEIDEINIWNAIQLATNRALFKIQDKSKEFGLCSLIKGAMILIDGNLSFKMCPDFVQIPQAMIINGDSLLKTIGFSSIIAKVCRDRFMINLKEEFPHIGFEQHKGYLTQKHQTNIKKFGPTRLHRQSFLKNL